MFSNPLQDFLPSKTNENDEALKMLSTPKSPTADFTLYETAQLKGLEGFKTLVDLSPEFKKYIQEGGPFTAFLPSNEGLRTLTDTQRERLVTDDDTRNKFLMSMIIPDRMIFEVDVDLNYSTLVSNALGEATRITRSPYNHIVVNGRAIALQTNILTMNAILYITDLPVVHSAWHFPNSLTGIAAADERFSKGTISDVIQLHPSLSILRSLFQNNMEDFFKMFEAQVTVFLPSDKAFQALGEESLAAIRVATTLPPLVRSWIFPGVLPSSAIPLAKFVKASTLEPSTYMVLVRHHNGDVSVDNLAVSARRDIRAVNGYVNIMDAVIVSPNKVN